MKRTLISILFTALTISACGPVKHDGKIVRTADGKLYLLDHRLGVTYALEELPKGQLDSLTTTAK